MLATTMQQCYHSANVLPMLTLLPTTYPIGFSPLHRTPVLLHDHNEFLNEEVFLKGIEIFVDIIENVANVW